MALPASTKERDPGTSPPAKKSEDKSDASAPTMTVPVTGRAFEGAQEGAAGPDASRPEGQGLSKKAKKRRRAREAKEAAAKPAEKPFAPTPEERTALAAEWGMAESDERFTAALTSRATHDYVKALTAAQRAVVTPDEIRGTVAIEAAEWDRRRRARLDLLTEDDKAVVAAGWGVAPDHTNVVWALRSQENWTFALALTAEQLPYLSAKHKKTHTPPTPEEVDATKKRLAEAEAKAKAEQEAKARAAAETARREKGLADWAEARKNLLEAVKARIAAEVPGLAIETVEKLVAGTNERIEKNKQINIPNQIKALEKSVDATIELEKKKRAVTEAAKGYTSLKGLLLRELQEQVLADPTQTVDDFRQQADAARVRQRNLEGVKDKPSEWARLLGLKLYKSGAAVPFEKLTPRAELPTHYSVDLDGIRAPVDLDLGTTAEALLDAVLLVPERHHRLHVTLETGISAGPDQLKLPHRYWTAAGAEATYDLFFYPGARPRWDEETHSKEDITTALDEAYDELRARLLKRAKEVLDKDCNA